MKLPYHGLLISGDVLVAAKGCNLHTFSLRDGSSLFTWRCPTLMNAEPQEANPGQENGSSEQTPVPGDAETPAEEDEDSGPPPKRRKVADGEDAEEKEADEEVGPEGGEKQVVRRRTKKRGRKRKLATWVPIQKPAELPMIQCLTGTTDGRHVVAVTGLDKSIWVFEHDGNGNLEQLSQRTMPKRPCSIALTPDNATILSADKFGDVYSLPLIPKDVPANRSPVSALSAPSTPATPATPATPSTPQPFKPQANPLTVHTKRNLKALANQKRVPQQPSTAEKPATAFFEHALLLGHVSMLTAIALAVRSDGKQYILTADRDEHIRVSRAAPQAHVIEGYCLGHDEFISRLCLVPRRPEILVSGGGDDVLFVWDWFKGEVLSTADLLPLVQALLPEQTRLAVSTLRAFEHRGGEDGGGGSTWVVAACERIPGVFIFRLEGNTLQHAHTAKLPGNPLDIVPFTRPDSSPRLLVTLDTPRDSSDSDVAGEAAQADHPSLVTLDWDASSNGWKTSPSPFIVVDGEEDSDAAITKEQLDKALYTTEILRKMGNEDD